MKSGFLGGWAPPLISFRGRLLAEFVQPGPSVLVFVADGDVNIRSSHQLRGKVKRRQNLVHDAGGFLAGLHFDVVVFG